MTSKPLIPVLAVAGVGLIGGSFAAALRRAGAVGRVIGVGRNPETLGRAQALGLIDEALPPAQAARAADVVMLAVPVGAMPAVLAEMAPHLRPHTIVTDAGSTKQDVIVAARAELGARARQFVPGHPIAGSDESGPQAADDDLYQGRCVILTPLPENSAEGVALVRSAWEACGAQVCDMPAAQHDSILASVSHLPHLLAFAYMTQVARSPDSAARLHHAGSGFRDFSRIAGSSPEMWRDVLFSNRDAVLHELADMRAVLDEMAAMLQDGDAAGLEAVLQLASDTRRAWGAQEKGSGSN